MTTRAVRTPDGSVSITLRTSHASRWNLGKPEYDFGGFLQPVDAAPILNETKAGSGIPVKFRLGGNRGLGISVRGYPASRRVDCDSGAPVDQIEVTVTAGNSSLAYDGTQDQYTYVWKTQKEWAGTCRQLVVNLKDGSLQSAMFKFR